MPIEFGSVRACSIGVVSAITLLLIRKFFIEVNYVRNLKKVSLKVLHKRLPFLGLQFCISVLSKEMVGSLTQNFGTKAGIF